jgi:putative ABC transport system permease protein
LGIINRALRNLSRRKIRALLVVIALGFSMAIMISIPAGIAANQTATHSVTQNLSDTITQTEASINQSLTQIDCSLTPSFEGFGFNPGNFTPPDRNGGGGIFPGNFTPGQFGGGFAPGQFGGGPFGGGGTTAMNETLYADISTVEGVAALVPALQVSEGQNVTISNFGRTFTRMIPDYIIKGVTLTSSLEDTYPILPTNITAGRNLKTGDSGVILLSENNTAFFNVGVGDTVTILDQPFTVIGIYRSSGVSDATTLYMNLSQAQALTNNTGYITSLQVFTQTSSDVTTVANAISSLHPELNVVTSQERLNQLQTTQASYAAQLESAESTMNESQTVAYQEIGVAVAATSLIVLFVMLYTVRERTKEIGTLKAIGFSSRTVMSQFLLEGILLSLMAGAVGVAIGIVAAPTLSSILLPTVNSGISRMFTQTPVTVTLDAQLILLAFGASVLLGGIGSLYPAWRASRTNPAEAMRYD